MSMNGCMDEVGICCLVSEIRWEMEREMLDEWVLANLPGYEHHPDDER